MTLWWIGNIILIAVVIPVVVAILIQVLVPIFQIRQYAEDILEYGAQFGPHLDAIAEELVKTRISSSRPVPRSGAMPERSTIFR